MRYARATHVHEGARKLALKVHTFVAKRVAGLIMLRGQAIEYIAKPLAGG
jgi:hypothetical protein